MGPFDQAPTVCWACAWGPASLLSGDCPVKASVAKPPVVLRTGGTFAITTWATPIQQRGRVQHSDPATQQPGRLSSRVDRRRTGRSGRSRRVGARRANRAARCRVPPLPPGADLHPVSTGSCEAVCPPRGSGDRYRPGLTLAFPMGDRLQFSHGHGLTVRLIDEGLDRICVKVCLRVRLTKVADTTGIGTSEKLHETFMQITGENTGYGAEPHEEDLGRKNGPSPRHDTAKVGPKSP